MFLMAREKIHWTKKMPKKDLEKFFKIELNNKEYNVIKDFADSDWKSSVESYRFEPFDKYIFAINQWGTKNGKVRTNARDSSLFYKKHINTLGAENFDLDKTEERSKELYNLIQKEIYYSYPNVDNNIAHNKSSLKETRKKNSTSGVPDPDLIWGFLILIFITLFFGLIFGGGDLSPGGPKFFGHDGG